MSDRDEVSVLLPTTEWTDACDQVAEQLYQKDELLIVCDAPEDPVTRQDPPDGVEILVAGEPTGCSGKANAVAYGMQQAANDRFVWTDADFSHNNNWLDKLVTAGQQHGPATAVPFWYGNRAWSLLEPWTMIFSTLLIYFSFGSTGNIAWGGGLTFTRDELDVTVERLTTELQQVLSDDALLSRHIDEFHPIKQMMTPVRVPGSLSVTYHRLVRFNRLIHVNQGMAGNLVISVLAAISTLLFPYVMIPTIVVATGLAYTMLGINRLTFVLSPIGLFFVPPVILAGMFLREFEWAGRRYRLNGKYDVEVINN
jgi:hypothetical protein